MFHNVQAATVVAVGTGMVVAGGYVLAKTMAPSPIFMKNADYTNHSVLVDKETLTRKSQFGPFSEFRRGDCRNIQTLYDAFQCGLKHGRDQPCLGYKKKGTNDYEWITYSQVDQHSINTGAGMIHRLNQAPGQDTRVCIFMKNCLEWVYIEQSCSRYSMVSVPLYDTLGEESCAFILNHVRTEVVFVDSQKKVEFLIRSHQQFPNLKYIVCTFAFKGELIERAQHCGMDVLLFSEILSSGEKHPQPLLLGGPDDISTIFYTSGTTGIPKGCMLSHRNLIGTIKSVTLVLGESAFGKKRETHLSFLPLTHVFERLVHVLMFLSSGKIAFFQGDVISLFDEMKIIQPTVLFAVPRILNRIYTGATSKMNKTNMGKFLYEKGLAAKSNEVQRGIIRKNSIWDYLLFQKVQAILGGRVEVTIVGSAPIEGTVLNFFRAVMGSIIIEAYGQTETGGCGTLTLLGDCSTGHVGPPCPGVSIRLSDVPELDIVAKRDLKGEVCIKGECCIKEYFNNPEMTAKLIDADGWLHTGDVGQWTEKGQLKIVDRCKHMFKLAQGEYLAPEKLENVYLLSPLVSQIFVTGNSMKDYCVAVAVPELDGWRSLGRIYGSLRDVCTDQESNEIIVKNLQELGKKHGLMGFEIVRKVTLWPDPMTIENGLITPTMKIKRTDVAKHFAEVVDTMYA